MNRKFKCVCLAALASFVLQIIDFDDEPSSKLTTNPLNNFPSADQDTLIIGDGIEHTMWFMRVSDTHLSMYFDQTRKPDLMRLCTEVIDIVKPSLVLATGDLTDSRSRLPLGTHQNEQDWKMYRDVKPSSQWLLFEVYCSNDDTIEFCNKHGNRQHDQRKAKPKLNLVHSDLSFNQQFNSMGPLISRI